MASRVMLIDDHPVVRQGLHSYLSLQSDLEVVAEAGTLAQARERLAAGGIDIVLLDLQMPDGSGLSLLQELAGGTQGPKVVVLTSFLEEGYLRNSLRLGAAGFLLKHSGTAALVDGIRAALRGELPVDPEALRLLAQEHDDPFAQLTKREREVLSLLAQGLSNRDMADRLGVREKTVKSHLGHIFDKLEVRDRTQAALLAREQGI